MNHSKQYQPSVLKLHTFTQRQVPFIFYSII